MAHRCGYILAAARTLEYCIDKIITMYLKVASWFKSGEPRVHDPILYFNLLDSSPPHTIYPREGSSRPITPPPRVPVNTSIRFLSGISGANRP